MDETIDEPLIVPEPIREKGRLLKSVLTRILDRFKGDDAGAGAWLLGQRPDLDGQSPYETFRRGEIKKLHALVLREAEASGRPLDGR